MGIELGSTVGDTDGTFDGNKLGHNEGTLEGTTDGFTLGSQNFKISEIYTLKRIVYVFLIAIRLFRVSSIFGLI